MLQKTNHLVHACDCDGLTLAAEEGNAEKLCERQVWGGGQRKKSELTLIRI